MTVSSPVLGYYARAKPTPNKALLALRAALQRQPKLAFCPPAASEATLRLARTLAEPVWPTRHYGTHARARSADNCVSRGPALSVVHGAHTTRLQRHDTFCWTAVS